ncbi:MAG: hypothetical protein HQ567_10760 [Candidatus Nealsonbacteria bacterium]|nr:hypothetical protein [Candidatus Nealsonbacteria bacterium]
MTPGASSRRAYSGALNTDDLVALAAAMKPTLPANMARTANLRFYRLAVMVTYFEDAPAEGSPCSIADRIRVMSVMGVAFK